MPKVKVFDSKGKESGEMKLSDALFSVPDVKKRVIEGETVEIERNINAVLHQAVVAEQANRRQGTHKAKTRGEVSGGGRKPWRQKKTGRARHGSSRSPIWSGGGVTFGPVPRSHAQKQNRKARRLAVRSALAAKLEAGALVAVDGIKFEEYKTKDAAAFLRAHDAEGPRVLVLLAEHNPFALRSFRNLPDVEVRTVPDFSARDLLVARKVIADSAALKRLEEMWSK